MSLRAVHIVVISASIALLFFFGFWAIQASRASGERVTFIWGAASILGGAALATYLAWFVAKIKRTGPQ